MNLVGKIFTVLIFVMSLIFMAFAIMVYATQKNWKSVVDNNQDTVEHPLGLSQKLIEARKRNQELTEANDRVNRDLEALKKEQAQVLAKLETEKNRLEKAERDNGQTIAELNTKMREAVKAMQATQETLDGLHKEVVELRDGVQKAHADRDAAFKEVVRLTDELHNAVNERTLLNERNVQLSAEYAKAKEALRYFGINENADYRSKQPPHPLDGVILAVTEPNVVEISLGEDDGLRKGHNMEVVRGGAYVGRIQVMRLEPNRAVCRVMPEMLKSPMQRGDRVYDKLD